MTNPERGEWPDLAGRIEHGVHRLAVRVYFEDTDFSGMVYHATYLRWCERGRSDFLRLSGLSHKSLASEASTEPCGFAVRRLTADFVRPSRIDDILTVETAVGEVTRASITMSQKVMLADSDVCRLSVQCVLVSFKGRLMRLPAVLLETLRWPLSLSPIRG